MQVRNKQGSSISMEGRTLLTLGGLLRGRGHVRVHVCDTPEFLKTKRACGTGHASSHRAAASCGDMGKGAHLHLPHTRLLLNDLSSNTPHLGSHISLFTSNHSKLQEILLSCFTSHSPFPDAVGEVILVRVTGRSFCSQEAQH